jgi:hypothetical protein
MLTFLIKLYCPKADHSIRIVDNHRKKLSLNTIVIGSRTQDSFPGLWPLFL